MTTPDLSTYRAIHRTLRLAAASIAEAAAVTSVGVGTQAAFTVPVVMAALAEVA